MVGGLRGAAVPLADCEGRCVVVSVAPADAGVHPGSGNRDHGKQDPESRWIPAFAGMTVRGRRAALAQSPLQIRIILTDRKSVV